MLTLQVAELKHAMAAQQREAELSRRNQELQSQLMLRDLEARLTAAPATSTAEASTQFKVRLCLAVLCAVGSEGASQPESRCRAQSKSLASLMLTTKTKGPGQLRQDSQHMLCRLFKCGAAGPFQHSAQA